MSDDPSQIALNHLNPPVLMAKKLQNPPIFHLKILQFFQVFVKTSPRRQPTAPSNLALPLMRRTSAVASYVKNERVNGISMGFYEEISWKMTGNTELTNDFLNMFLVTSDLE